MNKLKNIAVFCGANSGNKPVYTRMALALCDALLKRQWTLVNGGGNTGLMRIMADHMLTQGGRAIGVIPQSLVNVEVAHKGMSELHVTSSMLVRKEKITELSQGFIVFPGGPGTLDEFFDVYSGGKLNYHPHPIGILNIEGYFDPLIAMLDKMVENAFVRLVHRQMILVDSSPVGLLNQFETYVPPVEPFWIES